MKRQIRSYKILGDVLLQTLEEHPDGLQAKQACLYIEENFDIPHKFVQPVAIATKEQWQKIFGNRKRKDVPASELTKKIRTESKLHNSLRWIKEHLKVAGRLDKEALQDNIWKLDPLWEPDPTDPNLGVRPKDLTAEEKKITTKKTKTQNTANQVDDETKDLIYELHQIAKLLSPKNLRILIEIGKILSKEEHTTSPNLDS